ncbi:MAG: hypothetical protein IH851_05885 [Armatimonadetes bacterium]|nr:hypothetical protein [Armatimonadota bacterium]
MAGPIRYRPADVARWLEIGAGSMRRTNAPTRVPGGEIGRVILETVGKVVGQGKGALVQVAVRRLGHLEYRLYDDRIEVTTASSERCVSYDRISAIETMRPGEYRVVTRDGALRIKPYAWLNVTGLRVPFGWLRDGMEVPFELLIEELAGRAKIVVEKA